jgi:(p)ppGpp synthase/HD superfamily hydrolase
MLILFAKWVATFAHWSIGHKRKYTGNPYIDHPAEVVGILRSVGGDDWLIAAAWLHDVVEDTWMTHWMVRFLFGAEVAGLVKGVTDISKSSDGNRRTRKEMDRLHIWAQCSRCKTLKLADKISNLTSGIIRDRSFAPVYFKEASELLPGLKGGNKKLFDKVQSIIDQYAINSELTRHRI